MDTSRRGWRSVARVSGRVRHEGVGLRAILRVRGFRLLLGTRLVGQAGDGFGALMLDYCQAIDYNWAGLRL